MNNKEILLSEKQQLKRKQMLLKMEKEMEELKNDIKISKKANLKNNMIRRLKISLRTGQLIAPYALTAGITFGTLNAFGLTPFIIDDRKQNLQIKTEMDSLGNISYFDQYSDFDSTIGTISYTSKWKEQSNGFYERKIKIYSTENIKESIITEIINDADITSLDEVFGAPISSGIETKNNLKDEEINANPFLQAIIYSESENDFIVVKETATDDYAETSLWITSNLLFDLIIWIVRKKYSSFNYNECVDEIEKNYPLIDTKELTQKLKIRKNNYNRLTR